jgi:CheY-like chemotaxis protein
VEASAATALVKVARATFFASGAFAPIWNLALKKMGARWTCAVRRHLMFNMIRPCFLVIDNQYPGSISARKLVIETAQLNVITAYSAQEAIGLLSRFPAVDGIVLDTEVQGIPCQQLIERLRQIRGDVPIITVSPTGHDRCDGEEYHVSSYDPQALLDQLKHICAHDEHQAIRENEESNDGK